MKIAFRFKHETTMKQVFMTGVHRTEGEGEQGIGAVPESQTKIRDETKKWSAFGRQNSNDKNGHCTLCKKGILLLT